MSNLSKTLDYTQIPNLRAIKNRDFKTIPGERSKFNIGMGLPSYATAELPADDISKTGDLAFDSTIGDLTFFVEGTGWTPVSQDNIPKTYGGYYQEDSLGDVAYVANTMVALQTTPVLLPSSGMIIGGVGGIGLVNNSAHTSRFLCIASVSIRSDTGGTSAGIVIGKNNTPSFGNAGGVGILEFVGPGANTSIECSTIISLAPTDYIGIYIQPSASMVLNAAFINLTAIQIN